MHVFSMLSGTAKIKVGSEEYAIPDVGSDRTSIMVPASVTGWSIVGASKGAQILDRFTAVPEKVTRFQIMAPFREYLPGMAKAEVRGLYEDFGPENGASNVADEIVLDGEELAVKDVLKIMRGRNSTIIVREGAMRMAFGNKFVIDGWSGKPVIFKKGDRIRVTGTVRDTGAERYLEYSLTTAHGDVYSVKMNKVSKNMPDYTLKKVNKDGSLIVKIDYTKTPAEKAVYAVFEMLGRYMSDILSMDKVVDIVADKKMLGRAPAKAVERMFNSYFNKKVIDIKEYVSYDEKHGLVDNPDLCHMLEGSLADEKSITVFVGTKGNLTDKKLKNDQKLVELLK